MSLHHQFEVLVRHDFDWSDLNYAGIVNEYVDVAEAIGYRGNHICDFLSVSDVTPESHHVNAEFVEIGAGSLEFLSVARANRQTRTFACKLPRHHQSETSRSTSDQDCLIPE